MKRILLLILLLAVLLLCGCTAFLQVKPTQISSPEQLTPSTEPTEPPPGAAARSPGRHLAEHL